ncbi:MAG: hypothetical protein PHI66_04035 [Candidatus Pacebacteria bacterium]|nr:hypothetical protein [Candidatus Paceibacterota bacterium]
MTIKTYLLGMGLSTIVSFAAWVLVLQNVDPNSAGLLGFLLFYFTLFFALTSFFSLVGFYFRRKIFENSIEFKQVEIAFRQGMFFAVTFVGLLILQGERVLDVYSAFLFVLFVVVMEFYFLVKK